MKTSYRERVPLIAAVLRRLGRSATVAELYEELKGDERFGTPRRVAATIGYDQKQQRPVFAREGNDRIALRDATVDETWPGYAPEKSRIYERGQTVVPKRVRDAMAIEEGTVLTWEVRDGVAYVVAIPKDPVAALYGIMKDTGPTFDEYLAERNAERQRERELEADQEHRWHTYSTRRR